MLAELAQIIQEFRHAPILNRCKVHWTGRTTSVSAQRSPLVAHNKSTSFELRYWEMRPTNSATQLLFNFNDIVQYRSAGHPLDRSGDFNRTLVLPIWPMNYHELPGSHYVTFKVSPLIIPELNSLNYYTGNVIKREITQRHHNSKDRSKLMHNKNKKQLIWTCSQYNKERGFIE